MAHSHHHHHHHHPVANYNSAFAIGVGLNLVYVIVEAVFGFLTDSLALLADAGHNLSDIFSLCLAWGAFALAKKAASDQRTYGFRKVTILASLTSAILLLFVLGGIAWEAILRFNNPQPVSGSTVMIVAFIGVLINGGTAMLFAKGQKQDLNMKGAYLHLASDALVSFGVIIAGFIITVTGWLWIDPAISIAIVVVILLGTWGLLKDSINYSIDAVPDKVDIVALKTYLNGLPQVQSFHDLHIWAMSTTETAMTVHVVVEDDTDTASLLEHIREHLHHSYEIEHLTVQLETAEMASGCEAYQHQCGVAN